MDRAALVAPYYATDGPNWPNWPNWEDAGNWLSDKPLEEWEGVSTDDQGRVIALDLVRDHAYPLRGEIPSELANLTNMARLDLRDNELTGEYHLNWAI